MTVKSMDRNLSFITDPTHRRLLLRIIRNIEELNAAALYGSSERPKNKGNIVVADGSMWDALAVGDDGQVLTADSTQADGVSWQSASGGLISIAGASVGTGASITQALTGTVERLIISWSQVSISAVGNIRVQLGTGGSLTTTGYATATGTLLSNTAGWNFYNGAVAATRVATGLLVLEHLGSNLWVGSGVSYDETNANNHLSGRVTLAGALDIVGIAASAGVLDGGTWKVAYQLA